jgi:hypothetical protein
MGLKMKEKQELSAITVDLFNCRVELRMKLSSTDRCNSVDPSTYTSRLHTNSYSGTNELHFQFQSTAKESHCAGKSSCCSFIFKLM